jgi:DNA-binding FadR family transcriptional regulator
VREALRIPHSVDLVDLIDLFGISTQEQRLILEAFQKGDPSRADGAMKKHLTIVSIHDGWSVQRTAFRKLLFPLVLAKS